MTWVTENGVFGSGHIIQIQSDQPMDLPDRKEAARTGGWIIVAGADDSRVTRYRGNDAWRFVRRKSQMRPRRRSRRAA